MFLATATITEMRRRQMVWLGSALDISDVRAVEPPLKLNVVYFNDAVDRWRNINICKIAEEHGRHMTSLKLCMRLGLIRNTL